MSIYIKDPDERVDYTVNWADYLADGETISSATYTVPSGITQYQVITSSPNTTIWLSGGTHGDEYVVSITITTSAGRIAERSIKTICRNR